MKFNSLLLVSILMTAITIPSVMAEPIILEDSQKLSRYEGLEFSLFTGSLSEDCQKSYQVFQKSFSERFLKRYLKNVYIVKNLTYKSIPLSGHADTKKKNLYIVCNDMYASKWVEKTLHHEFLSVYLDKNDHKKSIKDFIGEWTSLHDDTNNFVHANKDDVDYYGSNFKLTSRNLNPKLYEKGFLTDYSSVSFEQDISVFAEYYFTEYETLNEISKRSGIIESKLNLFVDFLAEIKAQSNDEPKSLSQKLLQLKDNIFDL